MLHNIERRYKICFIPETAFLNCLSLSATSPSDVLTKISINGVPPGTIAMHRSYCQQRQKESVVLWNATWPIVPGCDHLPEIPVQITHIQVRATEPRRESACDQPLVRNAGTFTLELRSAAGEALDTVTFENPLTIAPDQELVLVGYHRTNSEPVGNAKVTGEYPLEGEIRTCCPTRWNSDGKKECLYKEAWVPAALLRFDGEPCWIPAMFVGPIGNATEELMDRIMEDVFHISAPESKGLQ